MPLLRVHLSKRPLLIMGTLNNLLSTRYMSLLSILFLLKQSLPVTNRARYAMNDFFKDPECISGAQWQTKRLGARCAVRHARRAPCDGSKCDNWLHMKPYPISCRDAVGHDSCARYRMFGHRLGPSRAVQRARQRLPCPAHSSLARRRAPAALRERIVW